MPRPPQAPNTPSTTPGPAQAQLLHCALPGVYACRISSDRAFGKHWHASFGIGLMAAGGHRSASGRGTVDTLAGNLLTHNPGEVHDGVPLQGQSRRWVMLHMDIHTLRSMAGHIEAGDGADVEFTQPVLQDPQLAGQLKRLLDGWAQRDSSGLDGGPGDDLAQLADESALTVLCTHWLQRHSTARVALHAPASMARVRERLADEAQSPPSLHTMASELGLSRYQVLRRFTEVYGITPHAWLRAHRLAQARALIAQGHPLAAAATDSGFADQSHMTRAFRATLGYSPGSGRSSLVLQPRSRRMP